VVERIPQQNLPFGARPRVPLTMATGQPLEIVSAPPPRRSALVGLLKNTRDKTPGDTRAKTGFFFKKIFFFYNELEVPTALCVHHQAREHQKIRGNRSHEGRARLLRVYGGRPRNRAAVAALPTESETGMPGEFAASNSAIRSDVLEARENSLGNRAGVARMFFNRLKFRRREIVGETSRLEGETAIHPRGRPTRNRPQACDRRGMNRSRSQKGRQDGRSIDALRTPRDATARQTT